MSKNKKKEALLKRRQKALARKKQKRQQAKKSFGGSLIGGGSVASYKKPTEQQLIQMFSESHKLWELPELSDFYSPAGPLIEHLGSLFRKESRIFQRLKRRLTPISRKKIFEQRKQLLTLCLDLETKEELRSRLNRAAQRFYQPNFPKYVLVKSLGDMLDDPKPALIEEASFFAELVARNVNHALEIAEKRGEEINLFLQEVLDVESGSKLGFSQLLKLAQRKDIGERLDHFLEEHPDFADFAQEKAEELIEEACKAVDEALFDDFLLPLEEIGQFTKRLPKKYVSERLREKVKPRATEEDSWVLLKTYETFCRLYRKDGKEERLKKKLDKKLEKLREGEDEKNFLLFKGAQTSFDYPLEENPFFSSLFKRSMEKVIRPG